MNIIERVKNILISPKKEWDVIATEQQSLSSVLTTYVVPLSLIGAAATLIGWGVIGRSYFGVSYTSWDWGVKYAIISVISVIVGFLATSFVVDALAPSFGSEKNINKSAQFVGYSYTASLVAAVLNILPSIGWLAGLVGGLYTLYLMWLGIGPMKKTPEDKKVVYLIVSIIVLIAIYFVLGMILVSVLGLGTPGGVGNIHISY